ncbi:MAG: MauE/DoxX family redox-associated membrane protein [Planctomycetota bacterium]|jgi:uncharacterized membrane protein YphA (DoxX/SURF4 family)
MRRLNLLLQVALGAVFLVAGALKIHDPVQAVLAVGAYDLLSPPLALAVGLLLPGLEVAVGAALLTGFLARGASGLAGLLAAGFLLFVGWASHRGLDVTCGCFGPWSAALRAGWQIALLDLCLLCGSVVVWRRQTPRGRG